MKKWIQQRAAAFHRPTQEMRAFYNRIHRLYWFVERHIRPGLQQVLLSLDDQLDMQNAPTVLEYCCGSGLLSQQLSPRFTHVTARDISEKMLTRARRLSKGLTNITFETGNLLNITDADNAFDFAFISFGLHLFGPDDRKQILKELMRVTRREVIIIEHLPKWELKVALVEWWEGSHYTDFISTEWRRVADDLNANFSKQIIGGTQVQIWRRR
ncbi:MAG: methyltransferase domain-containing protein [Deltaproteobacteria bacterium]|nr:methyltransferase domain-containing protein [Deltaproteobacteria bacterium]